MDTEERIFWLRMTVVGAIALVVILLGSMFYCYQKDVRMAELGFQKTTIVGTNCTYYQKANK